MVAVVKPFVNHYSCQYGIVTEHQVENVVVSYKQVHMFFQRTKFAFKAPWFRVYLTVDAWEVKITTINIAGKITGGSLSTPLVCSSFSLTRSL